MNYRGTTSLLLTTLISSLMLFSSGCSKKPVISPDSSMGSNSDPGTIISYPRAEGGGYSEQSLPIEGSLDDTSYSGSGMGSMGAIPADQQTDEYKRLHGRSTPGLSPIYFNFDQAGIRPDMVDRMIENADYLKQVPRASLIIEGNTDERGTKEYNLALAERRALNTKKYLVDLGINMNRIRTVSYGEERPLFYGQDEKAYSQNRRADFVVE